MYSLGAAYDGSNRGGVEIHSATQQLTDRGGILIHRGSRRRGT